MRKPSDIQFVGLEYAGTHRLRENRIRVEIFIGFTGGRLGIILARYYSANWGRGLSSEEGPEPCEALFFFLSPSIQHITYPRVSNGP